MESVLLITPPFTQLNTPYPATAYIKGFFNTINVTCKQSDLGIEVILKLFKKDTLKQLFKEIKRKNIKLSANSLRILTLEEEYTSTVDHIIRFLQNKNHTLAYSICNEGFLPEAGRFAELEDLDWAFGSLGIQDKARHLATLYLEDLADLIKETIDPHFGFTRYAERLGMSSPSFSPIYDELQQELSFIDRLLIEQLELQIKEHSPQLIGISIPFPGNLFGAFRCAQYVKSTYPEIKITIGGGYPNTELRQIEDPRVFEFIDFITLDDGERPLSCLIEHLDGKRELNDLKRTFALVDDKVTYLNGAKEADIPFTQIGTPDYSDLPIDKYLSVIEIANPMHRLWSDGRWNKLTMAHGCYWKKCSFCDISLDYIGNYEPATASLICDRIEEIIEQTGETGFHFVDEAAPPALMKEVALEILRRKLTVTWWTNIRFESRFTPDLCELLKASGCIAVSGGLEVASDRLLELMQKGVSVTQVAQVADNFTQSGIMVHAYLMYGFPTQTAQETIDALEMVRQLFMNGVIQSGFWHRFAMTAHSPIGIAPEKYGVNKVGPNFEGFAWNDLIHEDPSGTQHELFSEGLKKSLFNYMYGLGFDFSHQEWFEHNVPETTIEDGFIEEAITTNPGTIIPDNTRLVWIGAKPIINYYEKKKKGKSIMRAKILLRKRDLEHTIVLEKEEGKWLFDLFKKIDIKNPNKFTYGQLKESYSESDLGNFELFTRNQAWHELRKAGLLAI